MPLFGTKSNNQLATCEKDIQTILNEAIHWRDFSIIEGQRTAERQNFHWSKGRKLMASTNNKIRKNWRVVESAKVVTGKDGYEKESRHQGQPKSNAVDIVPYPEMWEDKNAFRELAGTIKTVQLQLLAAGKIERLLDWGPDMWNGFDPPHWELSRARIKE